MAQHGHSTLELESPGSHSATRIEWLIERSGWLIACVILLLTAIGLTGPGLLSQKVADNRDGALRVEYASIGRYEAPAELHMHWSQPRGAISEIRLAISRDFVDHTTAHAFVPAPHSVETASDKVVYTFDQAPNMKRGSILLRYQHASMGRLHFQIEFLGEPPVVLAQFVFP